MLVINDDRFAERAPLFRDKCYFRDGRIRNPLFLAPNYRMTALQGAVALAQLKKLPWIVQKRRSYAKELTRELNAIPGVKPPFIIEGVEHSYYL